MVSRLIQGSRLFVVVALLSAPACSGDSGTAPPPVDDTASRPAQVMVTPATDTLNWISATRQFSASVLNNTGLVLPNAVTWSSSSTAVATVSSSGLVTAVGVGTTTILAQAGGVSGTATLVVRQVPASLTKVSGDSQSATVGEVLGQPLIVEVRDQGNAVVAGGKLTWSVTAGGGLLQTSSSEADATGKGQATWKLGSTVGGQSVQVVSGSIGPVTFTATGKAPDVASVELLPVADTATSVGDTVRFTAQAKAANGAVIAGAAITYSVTTSSVATISSTGLATAQAAGQTKVIAQSGAKADTATLVVILPPPSSVSITGVEPAVLIEGQAATIRGSGFATTASLNQVTIDGLTATVTSASITSISITVPQSACLPPRQGQVKVTAGGGSATRAIKITPRSQADLDLSVFYYRYTYAGNGCLYLPGAAAGSEYLIGVISTSQTPSSLTAVKLTGLPGDASVQGVSPASTVPIVGQGTARFEQAAGTEWHPPMRTPGRTSAEALTIVPPRLGAGDAEMMARNIELRARLGPALPLPPTRASAPQATAAGDTLSLFADYSRTCSTSGQVRAVVRLVGANAIWLEDVANPSGTFTSSELAELDAFYASHVKGVHDAYFGSKSDVDLNGRILILMTKNVNASNKALGWVWWADLYPSTQCATSNQAEIFFGYVPDPGGTVGQAYTKAEVLGYYRTLLTHEITHIVQGNAAMFGAADSKATWESEGGASLAEQLVAYRLFGHASGQNLGYSAYDVGKDWYWNAWLADVFQFFGWDSTGDGSGRVLGAPEQCSWVGRDTEGNSGPCKGSAVYGVPSMVLRFAMDRWGSDYPGGEEAMMRRLTQSPYGGFASLQDVSGWRIEQTLADFYMALWADGRVYHAAGMRSWNLYDIFSRFQAQAQLQPYSASTASPELNASIRAGSTLYLHWTPTGATAPTSIKVTTPGGSPVPSHIAVWALRLR